MFVIQRRVWYKFVALVSVINCHINPLVTNGLSHSYQLDESTYIFRGNRSSFFLFLFHFSTKQNSPRWDAALWVKVNIFTFDNEVSAKIMIYNHIEYILLDKSLARIAKDQKLF